MTVEALMAAMEDAYINHPLAEEVEGESAVVVEPGAYNSLVKVVFAAYNR